VLSIGANNLPQFDEGNLVCVEFTNLECLRALFTLVVPSCVTSSMSHISLAELHYETLKNSSRFNADVIIFFAT